MSEWPRAKPAGGLANLDTGPFSSAREVGSRREGYDDGTRPDSCAVRTPLGVEFRRR
jgi:hypothetical protein